MCIIFFAYKSHPQYKLILAANRDEFYERPTENARFWMDYPKVLAGRDLEKMGTWMGINQGGGFAAITNYRNFSLHIDKPISRGSLVKDFLIGGLSPRIYMERIKVDSHKYNPFNLLIGNTSSLYYYSNVEDELKEVKPGVYGISNSFLDASWPKLVRGKGMFREIINSKLKINPKDLYDILFDRWFPEDKDLPDTGIGLELERILSPIFIEGSNYGTRSSTVLIIDKDNHVIFMEKSLEKNGTREWNEIEYRFDIIE